MPASAGVQVTSAVYGHRRVVRRVLHAEDTSAWSPCDQRLKCTRRRERPAQRASDAPTSATQASAASLAGGEIRETAIAQIDPEEYGIGRA